MDSSFFKGLLVWYAAFLFSTSLHEAAHAIAAAYGHDYTAYNAGQATLDPIPHMKREKFGMIVVPLLSYFINNGSWMIGWASAPFNPLWAARYPRRALLMSLAGPLSHLLPAGLAWLAMLAGLRLGWFVLPGEAWAQGYLVAPAAESGLVVPLALFVSVIFQLNLLLLTFNLVPLPPLDGAEIWYQFVKYEEPRLRLRHTMQSWSLLGMLAAWRLFPHVFTPVFVFSLGVLYSLGLK